MHTTLEIWFGRVDLHHLNIGCYASFIFKQRLIKVILRISIKYLLQLVEGARVSP